MKISSSKSLVRAPSKVRTVGDWVRTVVDSVISRSASSIRPRPMSTRPTRPTACVFARDEQHHPHKDEEGRQPGQVHGKHNGHHAGAHVGPQHHGQRRRQPHQPLAYER